MPIFDGNLPYTNLHELNLDWIVKLLKNVDEKTDNIDENVALAQQYAESAEHNAEILMNSFITPEMFNAVGDGITDDIIPIQNAIQYGLENNKTVYLPNTYYISDTIRVYGVPATDTKHGTVLIGNNFTRILTPNTLSSIIQILPSADGDSRAYGVIIKNITLVGHNSIQNGIYTNSPVSESIFENITVEYCQNGLFFNNNCYLCNFTNVRTYHSTNYGFLFENGNNTSNVFTKCYVDTCANAYKYNGQYSVFISCCADVISGIVFDLSSFRGVLVACGSESKVFTQMFHIGTSTIASILGGMFFGNPDLTGYYIRVESGSVLRIESATLNYNTTSTGSLFSIRANTRLVVRNSEIGGSFAGANYSSTSARYKINSAVETKTIDVTVDANNEVTVPDMSPNTYTILSAYSTTRTEWIVLPYRFNATTWKLKFMSRSDYFPTITNPDFTVLIKYVTDAVL